MKSRGYKLLLLLLVVTLFLQGRAMAARETEWPFSLIGWTDEYNGRGVRIAVIDTGISTKNLDGVNILEGKNYVFPECGTNDLVGHGTHVAGILLGSETLKIQGIAPGAELVPLVYYSCYPSGAAVNGGVEAICAAIFDAVDVYACDIINISSGVPEADAGLAAAAAYAEENGVLIVSAAGNDNLSSPETVYYPAAYGSVIGVGAAGTDGQAAPSSQRNDVMLLAPGEDIPAVANRNGTRAVPVSGTSYAAAYVTGTAARLLEANPRLTPAQVRGILCRSAVEAGAVGYDADSGWGLLNIKNSLAVEKQFIPFSDVDSKSWYYGAVLCEYRAGLFSGTGDTRFEPDAAMTRAMLVTALYRLENKQGTKRENVVMDAADKKWYSDAVNWGADAGIVSGGCGIGTNETMTREKMIMVLYRYAQYRGCFGSADEQTNIFAYTDVQDLSGDDLAAFRWACGAGMISGGPDMELAPKETATRAQAAMVLLRLTEYMAEKIIKK